MPRGVYGGVTRGYYYTYSFPQHESREECWACMIIPITFWIFASLTLSLGVYGTSQLVLAPNYSHLIEASPIFVKEIQLKYDEQEGGPVLYGFSNKPKLDVERNWSLKHTLYIDPDYHKEFAVWLNAGSKFWLSCEDKSFGFLDILLVVLKGEESLQEWIQDPSNPHLGLLRLKISGYGETEYIVKEDGNYYFVVGNFNQHSAEVVMRLNFTSKMYNTQTANYKCSMGKGLCAVKLSILQNSYALLTTPSGSNITGGRSVWSVELSYGARLLTYIIILGVIILVVYCIFRILGHLDQTTQTNTEPEESERTPLIPPKESTSDLSTYGTLGQDQESGLNSSTEDLYDGKICVICYDEPRSCFFVPCGHCATCYTCGQRIEIGENKTCPICRHTISKVKRLYNA
ncbi:E3 ubiquitin-protein ligase APD2 isoform X1 [Cryptomeria japonica]|uniref:E3 ubiquitin-protein ligase APD2 isoform X1 n=1 Tax=Cryptomeria japonica TaxID=3369 RepID=UPI0025ABF459|nr:E3 ubiquitin-protein ligase APD2 isoform X1 [Cryptomeria japonica]